MKKAEIRTSAYYDSVVLMQLQRNLSTLPNVNEAGVVMGTVANKDVLAQSDLLTPEIQAARADDLIIVIDALTEEAAADALAQVDTLLERKGERDLGSAATYRPKSIESATQMLPTASWAMISTPGRYAAAVAKDALAAQKHVFLYSDNVSLEDERSLKESAAQRGLLVMGPDCGTAIVNGVGLGFANRVRRGSIGVVGASGTGLQQVTSRIHQLGGGITHAIGTGGRDLSAEIGAITARQALDLFARDDETEVIVMISKPPSAEVAKQLLDAALQSRKPVVVNFIGYQRDENNQRGDAESAEDNLYFVDTLDATADMAVHLATGHAPEGEVDADLDANFHQSPTESSALASSSASKYLRGLFSGGTLAYEAMLLLRDYLPAVYSNAPLDKNYKLDKATVSRAHTIIDLGEDEFTVGRLHPMMDNDLRIKRLAQEAADPEVALILLDVVLGDGAHADPAGELAPAIESAIAAASAAGRELAVHAMVIGTADDPQDMMAQIERLSAAGAVCGSSVTGVVEAVGRVLHERAVGHGDGSAEAASAASTGEGRGDDVANLRDGSGAEMVGNSSQDSEVGRGRARTSADGTAHSDFVQVDLAVFREPLAAINIGIETFTNSLMEQGAAVVHVDWKPPAGGNEKLAGLLSKMRKK